MKALYASFSSSDQSLLVKSPAFVKITALALFSLTLFFLVRYFSAAADPVADFTAGIETEKNLTDPSPPPSISQPPPPRGSILERTGIIDENGAMTAVFIVGDYDDGIESVVNASESRKDGDENRGIGKGKIGKFGACDQSMSQYIPEKGKGLDCVVPRPKDYKFPVHWPKSRDEVWASNIPYTSLVDDKERNMVSRKKNKFVFPAGGTQFPHGVDQYIDQIAKMVPQIAFGQHTRVVLDIGGGVGSFGASLTKHDVLTLSIAPKDSNNNQIQFVLERGLPAMVAGLATRRLLYPSQAFELIHCSRCAVNWTRDEGILLLEANRVLRAGGYFVLAEQSVDNQEKLVEQRKELEDLTNRLCWELVKKEGEITIWQKPLNNSCYHNRDPTAKPSLCGTDDDADDVWYVNLKACITPLPENGYGANITAWPDRLHQPPDRLFSIKMDAILSRKEIYRADTNYMKDMANGYVGAFRWKKLNLRNVMDMKAGYGSFAAALVDAGIDCWVMNVVPVSGVNTLPVIYDRGFVGVMHDWCEPFDTYPRTYDLLNAIGLFSVERNRCNVSSIVLEMERILRPGGFAYIRDLTPAIDELEEMVRAVGWVVSKYDDSEGPHSNWKLLKCEKRM